MDTYIRLFNYHVRHAAQWKNGIHSHAKSSSVSRYRKITCV